MNYLAIATSAQHDVSPFDDELNVVNVVVTAPRGSSCERKFDLATRDFLPGKMLPQGVVFPFDYGFIPSTETPDGGDLNDLLFERDHEVDALGNPKEVIHVSANPKYGSEKKGAPTSYFMVAAKERIRVNCDLRHVTVVLCCDPKAFTYTNPLDGMQEGGCLCGSRTWTASTRGKTCPSGRASRLSKRRFASTRRPEARSKTYPCIGQATQPPCRSPSLRLAPAWSQASSMATGCPSTNATRT